MLEILYIFTLAVKVVMELVTQHQHLVAVELTAVETLAIAAAVVVVQPTSVLIKMTYMPELLLLAAVAEPFIEIHQQLQLVV